MSVDPVEFDSIEARFFRKHGAAAELLDNARNLAELERTRYDQFGFGDVAVLVANSRVFERA